MYCPGPQQTCLDEQILEAKRITVDTFDQTNETYPPPRFSATSAAVCHSGHAALVRVSTPIAPIGSSISTIPIALGEAYAETRRRHVRFLCAVLVRG